MESAQLHIVNGSAAGGTLRLALECSPKSILVEQDILSVGPLRKVQSLDEWRTLRCEFWDRIDPRWRTYNYGRGLLSHTDQLRKSEDIVVWVGGGASDQLLLTWVVNLFT